MAVPDPVPDPETPIDGGVSILLATAVGYGLKKVLDERKRKNQINIKD